MTHLQPSEQKPLSKKSATTLSASPPWFMGGQEGSPSKSQSSPKEKRKRKKSRLEGAPSSSKGAKGEGNGRTTSAARGPEALEYHPMLMKCAIAQKHVHCFERAKGPVNRCVFSKTDGVLGKIARDSWCLRVSRQSNDEQDRDPSLDVYCHLACCDPFVYGLWLHSIDGAKWYYRLEFDDHFSKFPGYETFVQHLSANNWSRDEISGLKNYWYNMIEHSANKGDLPTNQERADIVGYKRTCGMDTNKRVLMKKRASESQSAASAWAEGEEDEDEEENESASEGADEESEEF
jgi:hypothetical protein